MHSEKILECRVCEEIKHSAGSDQWTFS